jgi:hypothetical protein
MAMPNHTGFLLKQKVLEESGTFCLHSAGVQPTIPKFGTPTPSAVAV